VKRASQSTSVGFLVFIVGFFIQSGGAIVYLKGDPALKVLFSLFSPSVLQIGLTLLSNATAKDSYPGLSWSDVNKNWPTYDMSFQKIYLYLVLDSLLYLLLALYLDNVLPSRIICIFLRTYFLVDAYGTRRPLYYFLTKSYWTGNSRARTDLKKLTVEPTAHDAGDTDEDVVAERK
jgi:hypothetical protein